MAGGLLGGLQALGQSNAGQQIRQIGQDINQYADREHAQKQEEYKTTMAMNEFARGLQDYNRKNEIVSEELILKAVPEDLREFYRENLAPYGQKMQDGTVGYRKEDWQKMSAELRDPSKPHFSNMFKHKYIASMNRLEKADEEKKKAVESFKAKTGMTPEEAMASGNETELAPFRKDLSAIQNLDTIIQKETKAAKAALNQSRYSHPDFIKPDTTTTIDEQLALVVKAYSEADTEEERTKLKAQHDMLIKAKQAEKTPSKTFGDVQEVPGVFNVDESGNKVPVLGQQDSSGQWHVVPTGKGQTINVNTGDKSKATPATKTELQKGILNDNELITKLRTAVNLTDPEFLTTGGSVKYGVKKGLERVTGKSSPEDKEFIKKRSQWASSLITNLANFIKSISGAAVTEQEYERLKSTFPTPDKSISEFEGAMQQFAISAWQGMQRKKEALRRGINISDKQTFEEFASMNPLEGFGMPPESFTNQFIIGAKKNEQKALTPADAKADWIKRARETNPAASDNELSEYYDKNKKGK